MNIDGIPDLFDRFISVPDAAYPTREAAAISRRGIFLSDMFAMLHTQGVNRITFIDFTCSSFEDGILTPRGARFARLEAEKSKLGGKRKTRKRQNKKTKTRRGKKRIVQWSY